MYCRAISDDYGAVTSADFLGFRDQWLGLDGGVPTIFGDINGDEVVSATGRVERNSFRSPKVIACNESGAQSLRRRRRCFRNRVIDAPNARSLRRHCWLTHLPFGDPRKTNLFSDSSVVINVLLVILCWIPTRSPKSQSLAIMTPATMSVLGVSLESQA
jgi:hypothetical protein